jgi:predicted permease
MRDDFKSALRSLRSSSSVTAPALVVLTLAIGATTAIFSVVDAVALRGLPFSEQDRLVAIGERSKAPSQSAAARDPDALRAVAPQNYLDWAAQQQVFESMAAVASGWFTLRQPGAEPESIVPQRVTAGFFDVLRAHPAIGHPFTAENEVAGRERVVILSDAVWRRLFGADPNIVGRTIPLEDLEGGPAATGGVGYEVLGIMPPGFAYPLSSARPTDIWIPYVVPPNQRLRDPARGAWYLQVIARLKPGVSLIQAQAQMTQMASAIEDANPVWNKNVTIGVRPLRDHVVGTRIKSWMLMLLGAVTIVLLIACANISNLLLARASARERDTGIRAALGASRWRLVRLVLVESVMLSAAGTAAGVCLAWWLVAVLRASMPDDLPRVAAIALDGRVLLVSSAMSVLTAVLVGLVPAIRSSALDLSAALKDGTRTASSRGHHRLRSALVVVELALSLVLLVGAALFIGSFVSILRVDPGFDSTNLLVAQVTPRVESPTKPQSVSPALSELAERAAQIPGVTHAAVVFTGIPLTGYVTRTTISIPGRDIRELNPDGAGISIRQVTPDYHQALKIPLRAGRLFTQQDRQGALPVAIINETAAHRFFAGVNPIGQVAGLPQNRTIVGVVGDVREMTLETDPLPEAYLPLDQSEAFGGDVVVRTIGNPYDVLPALKRAVFAVLPEVPLRNVKTMERVVGGQIAQRKMSMVLLSLFGLLGVTIAAVGIYGVMSYLVAQRTREIGVRMALGATRINVMTMVLSNAAAVVAVGLTIGVVLSWSVSAVAKAFLFDLRPTDPRAFAAAALALSIAALLAATVPARRAASVDPVVSLRSE